MREPGGRNWVVLAQGLAWATCALAGDEARPARSLEQVRAETARTFARANFLKPREDGREGIERTYAPLLVEELANGQGVAGSTDVEKRTVYATSGHAPLNGARHDQVVYAWRDQIAKGPRDEGPTGLRGVRITLGPGGSPLLWEALSSEEAEPVLFVSKALEEAAKREFGDPLPGCRFAVERGAPNGDRPIVAGTLDDGPVPMGPYVYVGRPPRRDITTLLCRCSPSQVDGFEQTQEYLLSPVEAAQDVPGLDAFLRRTERPLDALLRWPSRLP